MSPEIMWTLDGSLATLRNSHLTAQLDISRPDLGLSQLATKGRVPEILLPEARLLRVSFPEAWGQLTVCDHWQRGTDVVAVYTPSQVPLYHPEIYWRCLPTDDTTWLAIELIVSVQTDLLDANLSSRVTGQYPATEVLWLAEGMESQPQKLKPGSAHMSEPDLEPGVLVVRPGDLPVSLLTMVYPSDFSRGDLVWDGNFIAVEAHLFPERMEKGVIRRGRMRSLIVRREADLELACRHFAEFLASPPPLTT